jgi:hypothetical protein
MRKKHVLIAVVGAILLAAPAFADSFGSPNFAIYGINSLSINDSQNATTVCVEGNAGSGGTFGLDKCLVQGSVYVTSAGNFTLGSNGAFTGTETIASLTSVNSQLFTESANLAAMAPTQTITGDIMTNITFAAGVYQINGNINENQEVLTLNGPGTFVFNITGTVSFSCSQVVLNNATAGNVIFNIASSGTSTWNKDCTTWSGTILDPTGTVDIHNQWNLGAFDSQVFGNSVLLHSAGSIVQPSEVPEPASIVLFGTGLSAVDLLRRRRVRCQS